MGEKYTRTSTFEQIDGDWRLADPHTNAIADPEIEPLSTFQASPPDESDPVPIEAAVARATSDSGTVRVRPAAFLFSAITNNSYNASRTRYGA